MPEHSHRYEFGAPRGGWPRFGPDGTRIREEVEPVRCPSCGEIVAPASAGTDVTAEEGASGAVSVDGEVAHACGVQRNEAPARDAPRAAQAAGPSTTE